MTQTLVDAIRALVDGRTWNDATDGHVNPGVHKHLAALSDVARVVTLAIDVTAAEMRRPGATDDDLAALKRRVAAAVSEAIS